MKHLSKALTKELASLQKKCVGLYINPYTQKAEPVMDIGAYTFMTLAIGNLFGASEDHYPKNENHQIILFPEGKTLHQMMEDPRMFYDWYRENLKNVK
jgi:hypothetical protein